MWWQLISGAATSQVEGAAERANVRASNRIRRVNAETSNQVRRATNAFVAARGNLNRYIQSVNNQEAMQAVGRAYADTLRGGIRAQDQLRNKDFMMQLDAAETSGRAVASQGAAGVSGQVVDNVNAATSLRAAIMGEAVKRQETMLTYEVAQRAQIVASQMTRSLDSSIILDAIDYNEDVAQQTAEYKNLALALRGMARGAGDGASLYQPKEPEKQQRMDTGWDEAVKEVRLGREPVSRDGTMASSYGDFSGFSLAKTEPAETNPYSISYGTAKFNLNVGQSYTGL